MSRTGPLSHAAAKEKHVNGMTNGHDARVKVEDKMDDAQLNRLAAGVPVDAASPNGTVSTIIMCVQLSHLSRLASGTTRKDGRH